MTEAAREEGSEGLAFPLDGVGKIEREHEERYPTLLKNLEEGVVFKRNDEYVRKCRDCGHIHFGKIAPEVCPICIHSQAYFEIHSINYQGGTYDKRCIRRVRPNGQAYFGRRKPYFNR